MPTVSLWKKRVKSIQSIGAERGDDRISVTVDYLIRLGIDAHGRGEKPRPS